MKRPLTFILAIAMVMASFAFSDIGATCGANDNAAGVALITEIARVYWELSKAGLLGVQVIVAGVGAEESGLIGSWAIAEADMAWRPKGAVTADELKRFVAAYNFDCVASSDAWNAGMTINLRQWYNSGNFPPSWTLWPPTPSPQLKGFTTCCSLTLTNATRFSVRPPIHFRQNLQEDM